MSSIKIKELWRNVQHVAVFERKVGFQAATINCSVRYDLFYEQMLLALK
jgi:hypothetical protein